MNTRTIKTACGKVAMLAMAGTLALGAGASSVTIDSVTQRWPWNNKVDIKYTIDGGQTLTADGTGDVYCRLEFTATVNGQNVLIDGRAIGANASSGTHTATWTPSPELRVKALDCTMTARLLSADNPSGDDYMVIDLDTGDVTFEGMLYSQELSNSRYNSDTSGPAGANVYKTDKMVLRKVPRWADRASLPNATTLASLSGYPTGDNTSASGYEASSNKQTNWVTRLDYYIGIFPVTQAQYVKFGQENPSGKTDVIDGNIVGYRPVESMSWNDLRISGTASGDPIPAVDSNTGTYLQRLNYLTGNKFAFDLPTEVMSEIACRAGKNGGHYYWESGALGTYAVFNQSSTLAVGSKAPNAWGLYDTIGNVWEFCRDRNGLGNMADISDPFIPYDNGASITVRGSGTYSSNTVRYFYASYRNYAGADWSQSTCGFRVAYIAK